MSTLNISLPEAMKAFVETQVASGQYGSASDYIRDLIRSDQRRRAEQELESKLLEALDSGNYQKLSTESLDRLRARVKKTAAGKTKDSA